VSELQSTARVSQMCARGLRTGKQRRAEINVQQLSSDCKTLA
jgi:hypothetical protein